MDTGNWLTIIGMVLVPATAIYLFVYRLDKRVSTIEDRCKSHQAVIDSITQLNSRLDKLDAHDEIFRRVIGPHLEGIIHSPRAVKRDELVSKLTAGTIGKDELPDLIDMLRLAIQSQDWSAEKKLAGAWLLARATQMMNESPYDRRQHRRPC